LPDQKAWRK